MAECECRKVSRRGFISMLGAGLVVAAAPALIAESTFTPTATFYSGLIEASNELLGSGNSLLSAQMITRDALRVLHQQSSFLASIHRNYDRTFAPAVLSDFNGRVVEPAIAQPRVRLPDRRTQG